MGLGFGHWLKGDRGQRHRYISDPKGILMRSLMLAVGGALLVMLLGASYAGAAAVLKTNVSGVRVDGLEAGGNISETSSALSFQGTFFGFRAISICEVTLRGTLRTGLIVVGLTGLTRLGQVTEARINRCSRNSATILTETLPWDVGSLGGETGVLLEGTTQTGIVGVNLGVSFRVKNEITECLVDRGSVKFLYDNAARIIVGTAGITNINTCTTREGTRLSAELVGTFAVTPNTLRVTALLLREPISLP